MSSLPQEIEEEILLRLPLKSILRFKSVCKSWYTLIYSPKFVNHHLTYTSKNPKLMVYKYIFYSVDYSSILSASSSPSSSSTCNSKIAILMDYPVKGEDVSVSSCYIKILGSCNGLLCIGVNGNENHRLIIWNPSTKESKKIIEPDCGAGTKAYGFGYDSKISKYKLVCVARSEIYVCTLESCYRWRRITKIPYNHLNESGGLLLSGVVHWLVTQGSSRDIFAFDIISETFMSMHVPEETIMLNQNGGRYLRLLGDSLCLVCGVAYVQVDVWVMQNYGLAESWTKQFTTTQVEICKNPYSLKFYWSFENGEILIQTVHGLGLYNQENDSVKLLKVNGTVDSCYAMTSQSYVESLVSPTCYLNLCT